MIRHPSLSLSVTGCFDAHYPKDQLASSTRSRMRTSFGHWERLTDSIAVGEITNETVAKFRSDLLNEDYEARTIRAIWGDVRAVLRLMGPPSHGNPFALGHLSGFLAMRPLKMVHQRPTRIPLDNLSAMYAGCWRARSTRVGVPPVDWWRTLIVMAYTSGLRRGDLFRLKWSQLDLDAGLMDFTARKTGKADVWPLHPVAVKHLRRIAIGKTFVFAGVWSKYGGGFYTHWRSLREAAGIAEEFCLHDIRRTAASEIERIDKGMAEEFLQHAPRKVTDVSYLNRLEEMTEALQKMRIPAVFEMDNPPQIMAPVASTKREPKPSEWRIVTGGFYFRGQFFECLSTTRLRLLAAFTATSDPVDWRGVLKAAYGSLRRDMARPKKRAHGQAWDLRIWLRKVLGLPGTVDPVPCVARGDGGAWTVWIP